MAWRHGTKYGYKIRGCRCELCCAATLAKENMARDEAGVIATLVDTDTGQTVAFHVPGLVRPAVEAIAERCDAMGDTWKVRSLSTPRTITRDLKGSRGLDHPGGLMTEAPPEQNLLGKLGRYDLLAPELVSSSAPARSRRR